MSMSDERTGVDKRSGSQPSVDEVNDPRRGQPTAPGAANPFSGGGPGSSGGGIPGLAAFQQVHVYAPAAQSEQPPAEQQEAAAADEAPHSPHMAEAADWDDGAEAGHPHPELEAYDAAPVAGDALAAEPAPQGYTPEDYFQQPQQEYPQQEYPQQDYPEQEYPELQHPQDDAGDPSPESVAGIAADDAAEPQPAPYPDLESYIASEQASAPQDDPDLDHQPGDDPAQQAADQYAYASTTEPQPDPQGDPEAAYALQPFEAHYSQHPEVSLGSFDEPNQGPGSQPFFPDGDQVDADFGAPDEADDSPPPKARKGRKAIMFGGGLLGALVIGGVLAFAFKDSINLPLSDGGAPPLIQADRTPVKVTPDQPGGKEFPHKNKQIYDRLNGSERAETERLVSRQEQVAPAPAATGLDADTAAGPAQGATTAQPTPAAPAQSTEGPRKVRTLQIRPDGQVVQQQAAQQPAAAPAPAVPPLPGSDSGATPGIAVTMPQPAASPAAAPATPATTVVPAAPAAPPAGTQPPPAQTATTAAPATPAPLPAPRPTPAAAAPAATAAPANPAAASGQSSSIYVVQVASRRSQAMALAAYADLQQKYTSLLGNYQPMIQSADLGQRGVWYRLRVGPMSQKQEADSLCRKLRRAGLRSCLVRPL